MIRPRCQARKSTGCEWRPAPIPIELGLRDQEIGDWRIELGLHYGPSIRGDIDRTRAAGLEFAVVGDIVHVAGWRTILSRIREQ